MTIAITRKISPRFNECEITHIARSPINLEIARQEHEGYVEALKTLGCQVVELPEEMGFPDSVFVEDAAVILPEAAILTLPGADSRKGEVALIEEALTPFRALLRVGKPASVDGGDVLVLGKTIYVGMSTRSNGEAVRQMQALLAGFGYQVRGVALRGILHLKSAVTKVDEETILIQPNWVDADVFKGYKWIEVHPSEAHGANCLPLGGEVIYPSAFPRTRERLEAKGHKIRSVKVDELAKAEGAVTCCSLILD